MIVCAFYSLHLSFFRGDVVNGGFGLVLDGSDVCFVLHAHVIHAYTCTCVCTCSIPNMNTT